MKKVLALVLIAVGFFLTAHGLSNFPFEKDYPLETETVITPILALAALLSGIFLLKGSSSKHDVIE
ncbi:hypothetical protein [Microbulbifer epialgicus]|uniref:PEP-CTERM protein-sorting domain-containing protein n=1 Tax=Microbulbifer epialgicus TaxID=393907 RepID=A0ABV4NUT0_9GAMM